MENIKKKPKNKKTLQTTSPHSATCYKQEQLFEKYQ